LELLTIGGLVSLGAYFLLLLKTARVWLKTYLQKRNDHLFLALLMGMVTLLIIQLLLPPSFLILTLTFLFLALLALDQAKEEVIFLPSKNLSLIVLGLATGLVIVVFYVWGRAYAADFYFRKSLNALTQNQGAQVYNYQIKAINYNPYSSLYHRTYSQTNFALANSIASQGELSDQDRTNITQLIQQAIREAKIAANLNPSDATNWENLAQIYRNLINFAQGADEWATAAYRQAITTDPLNPRIRLNLGGLFYTLQDYETATRQFENSVNLKPDYANGYYNLAAAYRERGMYQEAYLSMQAAASLIPIDSADYQKAKNELDELAKLLPPEATPSAQQAPTEAEEVLTEPQPLPTSAVEPPIELPEEAGPEISPAPSPTSTP
jgi:tetratricopeptide (TPR) repeat protein